MIKVRDRTMEHVRDMARAQAFYRDVLGLKPADADGLSDKSVKNFWKGFGGPSW